MVMERYLPAGREGIGAYCVECPTQPFVADDDRDAHDVWHVEQTAAADPNQDDLF